MRLSVKLILCAMVFLFAACQGAPQIEEPTPELDASSPTLVPTPIGGGSGEVAYASFRAEDTGIHLISLENQTTAPFLIDEGRRLTYPAWSSDGKYLAVAYMVNPDDTEIAIYAVEEDALRILTDAPEALDSEPTWSPDGERIAYTTNVAKMENCSAGIDIQVIRVDNGQNSMITDSLGWGEVNNPICFDQAQWNTAPSWSPDGQWIVFETNRDGNDEIYLMDPDGGQLRNLSDHPGRDKYPSWSPDGSKIAFSSNRDGNQEIYIMSLDGSEPMRVTQHASDDKRPAWSPDGRMIAFYSDRESRGNFDIYIIPVDGGNAVKLTSNLDFDGYPAWRP